MGTAIAIWILFGLAGAAIGVRVGRRGRWGGLGQLVAGLIGLFAGGVIFLGFWALLFRLCNVVRCSGSGMFVGT